MTQDQAPRRGITPPKGRPTRSRGTVEAEKRVFGPTAQWIAAAFLLALIFLTIILLFDGGDFNVFNGGHSG